jgi:aminoglycoside phosphotransferase (APT) family kinase protein
MLAALHQIAVPESQLQRGVAPATILGHVEEEAADILRFLPERRETLQRVTNALTTFAPGPEQQIPRATLHGAFKLAQILCRETSGELALVDFDAMACGDPLYDLAEFIASLVFLRPSNGIADAPLREGVEMFLAEYQKLVPWRCDRRRLAWYAVAFLLGKLHSLLKRREARGTENIVAAFELIDEWWNWLRP